MYLACRGCGRVALLIIVVVCQYVNGLVFFLHIFELLLFLKSKGRVVCVGVDLSVYGDMNARGAFSFDFICP